MPDTSGRLNDSPPPADPADQTKPAASDATASSPLSSDADAVASSPLGSSQPSSPIAKPSTSDAPEHKPPLKPGTGKSKKSSAMGEAGEAGDHAIAIVPKKRAPTSRELHLDQYVTRDFIHASAIYQQESEATEVIRAKRREADYYQMLRRERQTNPGAIFGAGFSGFGNGTTDSTKGGRCVLYPFQRKRPGGRRAGELRLPRAALQKQADAVEMLVPVRLDVDFDKIKLRDTFTWNLHDRVVSMQLFAEQLVEDFHLPMHPHLVSLVQNSLQEQVNDYHPHVFLADDPLDPTLPYTAYKNDDMRVLVKLNITIGQHNLTDQFEWDINNPLNSPEEFAQLLTREMSLSGEFTTAIAHSIREQCQLYTKALFVTGHPFDGRPVEDEDVRTAMLPSPLPSIFRQSVHAKDFTPMLYELTEQDLERAEKIGAREDRRLKRRTNRRGGPTVPDLKEIPKTHRSQIVSSVLPGAVPKVSDLEKTRTTKPLKDGDSEEEESESEAEETPPEKAIPGYANMTRRQRMAAMNAMNSLKASTPSGSGGGRSATPESHMTLGRSAHEPVQPSHLRQQQSFPPPVPAPPTSQPRNQYARHIDAPIHQDSLLLTLKVPLPGYRNLFQALQRREAMERQRRQQEAARQQQQQVAAAQMAPPPQVAMKAPQESTSVVESTPVRPLLSVCLIFCTALTDPLISPCRQLSCLLQTPLHRQLYKHPHKHPPPPPHPPPPRLPLRPRAWPPRRRRRQSG